MWPLLSRYLAHSQLCLRSHDQTSDHFRRTFVCGDPDHPRLRRDQRVRLLAGLQGRERPLAGEYSDRLFLRRIRARGKSDPRCCRSGFQGDRLRRGGRRRCLRRGGDPQNSCRGGGGRRRCRIVSRGKISRLERPHQGGTDPYRQVGHRHSRRGFFRGRHADPFDSLRIPHGTVSRAERNERCRATTRSFSWATSRAMCS